MKATEQRKVTWAIGLVGGADAPANSAYIAQAIGKSAK
jgi:hypothetical protein